MQASAASKPGKKFCTARKAPSGSSWLMLMQPPASCHAGVCASGTCQSYTRQPPRPSEAHTPKRPWGVCSWLTA